MDHDLTSLSKLITTTLAQHPSGVTEDEMRSKGFRLITNTEYRDALLRKDPEISIWRPLCTDDEEATVAFAFQTKLTQHLATAIPISPLGEIRLRRLSFSLMSDNR